MNLHPGDGNGLSHLPSTLTIGRNLSMFIARRWWIVAIVLGLSLLVASLRSCGDSPTYTASAMLYVQPAPEATARTARRNATAFDLLSELERIRSTQVLAAVLVTPQIGDLRTFQTPDSRLDTLRNRSAAWLKDDGLIVITFESENSSDAVRIANAIAESYQLLSTTQPRTRSSQLLQNSPQEQPDRDQAIAGSSTMPALPGKSVVASTEPAQPTILLRPLKDLTESLAQAQLDEAAAKSAYESLAQTIMTDPDKAKELTRLQAQPIAEMTASDETLLRQETLALEQRLEELSARYLPNHPQILSLQSEINQRNAACFLSVKSRWEHARQRVQELQEAIALQRPPAADQPQIALASDQVDAAHGGAQQASIDSRSPLSGAQGPWRPMDVKIIEPARAASVTVQSRRATILWNGLLIGALLGVALTFLDPRFRSAAEITSALDLPILGAIPHTHGIQPDGVRARKVHLDPASEVANAYRTVSTALYFYSPDTVARSILVTSPARGDGKTTLSCNLAIALAQTGQKTLLIDGNLRHPALHEIFRSDNAVGLSAVIATGGTIDQAIQHTEIKNLDILPAGPLVPNSADLLDSDRFAEILRQVHDRYDHIIVDSPPDVPAGDARILGAMCDMTLLVLKAHQSGRSAAVRTRDTLESGGARFLGTILNDIPRGSMRRIALGAGRADAHRPDRPHRPKLASDIFKAITGSR